MIHLMAVAFHNLPQAKHWWLGFFIYFTIGFITTMAIAYAGIWFILSSPPYPF